jgi:uncharacterized protein (TIGR03067 family)
MARWFVFLLVLLPLPVLADEPDPEPPLAGLRQLDGEWEPVSIKFRGMERKVTPGRGVNMIIKNGKITRLLLAKVKGKLTDLTSTIKVDPRKSPAHIDLTVIATKRTTYGIYKLSGDELTLSSGMPRVADRPKDFESAVAVMVYKRKKK